MSSQCTRCGSYATKIVGGNDETDGESTRTETYRCEDCDNEFSNTLSASPSHDSSWSSSNDWYNY
jgi:transposase-like protein